MIQADILLFRASSFEVPRQAGSNAAIVPGFVLLDILHKLGYCYDSYFSVLLQPTNVPH